MNHQIFLVGLPGAGKTTLGLELALKLHYPFIDLDREIEKHTKRSIRKIFEEQGEPAFRQMEHEHLRRVIDETDMFVLATGGGTPCFFDNMELMKKSGKTFFIDTPVEWIQQRLQQDTSRPLMQSNTLEELYEKRIHWYEQAHHQTHSLEELERFLRT